MKDNNNSQRSAGVPRPYASKTLPTPGNVLERIVSPFKIWEVLVFVAATFVLSLAALVTYGGFSFSSTLVSVGGLAATAAIGVGFSGRRDSDVRQVPSIQDVSNTSRYVTAASRLVIYTIVTALISMVVLLVGHIVYPQGAIAVASRIVITGVIVLSIIASYAVVRTLCSFSSELSESPITVPVKVSSIPEILSIVGFIIAPLAVFVAGSLWNSDPLIVVSFSFTIVDSLAIVMATLLLYVSAVARL